MWPTSWQKAILPRSQRLERFSRPKKFVTWWNHTIQTPYKVFPNVQEGTPWVSFSTRVSRLRVTSIPKKGASFSRYWVSNPEQCFTLNALPEESSSKKSTLNPGIYKALELDSNFSRCNIFHWSENNCK